MIVWSLRFGDDTEARVRKARKIRRKEMFGDEGEGLDVEERRAVKVR